MSLLNVFKDIAEGRKPKKIETYDYLRKLPHGHPGPLWQMV